MRVAADERALKRRLDDYLWRERCPPSAALRAIIEEYFLPFERVAIIGGMVRDFARGGRRAFRSDVDLVIDAASDAVVALAVRLGAKANRFGGYSVVNDGWKIDFWALPRTWAFTNGHASGSRMEDLVSCTFFDWDSVLYDLKSRAVICEANYMDRLRSGRIDIKLMPTPSVDANLLRAIRRILLWDIEPGPVLASFIDGHLTADRMARLTRADRAVYSSSLLTRIGSAEALRGHIARRSDRVGIATSYARQMALPWV